MVRSKDFARMLGLSIVMVSLLLTLTLPVSGGMPSAGKAASQPPMGAPESAHVNCVQALQASEVPIFAVSDGGSCRAEMTPGTFPEWVRAGGRTCRCSCGYPCKTDADCGGGVGSCRGGISCC